MALAACGLLAWRLEGPCTAYDFERCTAHNLSTNFVRYTAQDFERCTAHNLGKCMARQRRTAASKGGELRTRVRPGLLVRACCTSARGKEKRVRANMGVHRCGCLCS